MTRDIFFLSYMESNADNNWSALNQRTENARRLHGVEGVKNAHRQIAETATTDFFFVVDGDNGVHDDFDFTLPQDLNREALYVWRAQNPVNDLCYGYGGIKLYNKWLLLENAKATSVDIATSIAPIYVPVMVVASTTHFNSTALESWRGAFREASKLTLNIFKHPHDSASRARLQTWKTVGDDRPFGKECVLGANMGHNYTLLYQNNPEQLARINDFHWLNGLFSSLQLD